MKKLMILWYGDVRGATAIEYGLIVAAISLVILGSFFAFGNGFNTMLSTLTGWFDN